MVDWKNPVVIAYEAEILIRFVHILGGLYLWEFIVTLPYEWSVYIGKQRFKWSMLIYVACRWLTLIDIALFLTVFNVKTELNCSAATKAITALAHVAIGLTSVLLMLRTIAINGGAKWVVFPLVAILLANWGTLLHGIYVADAVWVPELQSCSIVNAATARINVWVSFCSDLILFVVSVVGLLRKEGVSRLWRLLFRQGLIWMFASTVGYLLPAIFLLINLNDVMDYMFEPFAVVVMTICATRMYKDLSEYMVPKALIRTDFMSRSAGSSRFAKASKMTPGDTLPVTIEMETVTDYMTSDKSRPSPQLYLKAGTDISDRDSGERTWGSQQPEDCV
ncbi:hypothetical protein GLOTRDRAFT_136045 [Gloeophyllum trabeum ATCC 11539]|uniref:Uncharacterized protein n=1 Tax=Gloeophyllum trabeum (strain ATCC 11539 / FP-39264 / Madison 617) TaxID=670483 RepID=S7RW43_GLOTA|nr:uncharacterized protein GLOTRDRAFT_136045 [Gloeophyllum trabeum ATCC 11539]EPQ59075.1 hypothetical protein GLOTRDRAFT_136045 [Gloeophyllum trabeum ATCC 11539]